MASAQSFFFIAGEPSGDALGASLMGALKARVSEPSFEGVGGDLMEAQGLSSMMDMEELCVMGLVEVVEHFPRLVRLIHGLVEEIEKQQPDVVVTVDLPDFNFRVAEKLKKRGLYKGKIYHYVAPSVWAWRPGRAKKIAQFLDGVMCLFPFEPPYFEKVGLRSEYVGHPMIETPLDSYNSEGFQEVFGMTKDVKKIGLMFGSRESELASHAKVILHAAELILEQEPHVHFVVPTLPNLYLEVVNIMQGAGAPFSVFQKPEHKWQAFLSCDAAIAVSGTVGLELAYANVPHVIGYRVNPLTWVVAKMLIKTRYAHLGNILLDQRVVPEYLQGMFKPERIAKGVLEILKYPEKAQYQKEAFAALRQAMKPDASFVPSQKAADFILKG